VFRRGVWVILLRWTSLLPTYTGRVIDYKLSDIQISNIVAPTWWCTPPAFYSFFVFLMMFVASLILDFVNFHLDRTLMYYFLFDINNILRMSWMMRALK